MSQKTCLCALHDGLEVWAGEGWRNTAILSPFHAAPPSPSAGLDTCFNRKGAEDADSGSRVILNEVKDLSDLVFFRRLFAPKDSSLRSE